MTETFAALLLAHALADFVLQPAAWVAAKARPLTLAKHGLVVLALSLAATGAPHSALVALTVAHIAIDAAKSRLAEPGLGPFLADQAAHLLTLAVAAALVPGLWADGLWAGGLWQGAPWAGETAWLPALFAYGAGAILATRAGQFAVAYLMQAHGTPEPPGEGLPQGGATIGLLERGLIFVLVLTGEIGAIGFLIAAKSVLRFGTVSESRAASEYVIIGTLASFGWAIVVALAAQGLAGLLPPLEMAAPGP